MIRNTKNILMTALAMALSVAMTHSCVAVGTAADTHRKPKKVVVEKKKEPKRAKPKAEKLPKKSKTKAGKTTSKSSSWRTDATTGASPRTR